MGFLVLILYPAPPPPLHTTLSHSLFHIQLCHTPSTCVLRGRCGTCVAGVALAWQAWHLLTSTFVLHGRCGTWRHLPAFGVAGVALLALGWVWWRAWAPVSRPGHRGTFWQACGTWWHRRSICVAGVALGRIHLVFAWQAWHSWHWAQHFHTRHCHTQLLHMQPFHTPLFHKKLFHKTLVFHTLDKKWIIEVIRWELNPLTCNWIRKRKTDGRYVILASQNDFTLWTGVFVGLSPVEKPQAPCIYGQCQKVEVLHLFRCYTHTHPAGAGSTLKGKRKRTSGHKRRAEGQEQCRGEGNKRTSRTNLQGETDLTSTGHTPKPHDTLQRGTGEKLGTEWGTSWWRKGKQQVIPKTGPLSIKPHGHKRLFKFNRIRCTKCLTSPDNNQKKKNHTWKAWTCLRNPMCCMLHPTLGQHWKTVSGCSARLQARGDAGSKDS